MGSATLIPILLLCNIVQQRVKLLQRFSWAVHSIQLGNECWAADEFSFNVEKAKTNLQTQKKKGCKAWGKGC
uniref:Putative secreted protein n=1 Tax=Anopheles marajoara TaxID=58244 RepID=A0A2M4CDU3_9DIPT